MLKIFSLLTHCVQIFY